MTKNETRQRLFIFRSICRLITSSITKIDGYQRLLMFRSIDKWTGPMTKNEKYGLGAPSRGGLYLVGKPNIINIIILMYIDKVSTYE